MAVLLVVFGLRTMVKRTSKSLIYVLIAVQLLINILISVQPYSLASQGTPAQGQGIDVRQFYTREQFKDMLMQKGGKHLVLVSYTPNRIFYNQWVFNNADIDKESIVWAWAMNKKEDAKLIAYFIDRQVWRITVDTEHYPPPKSYEQR
jgi:hypothetical protein